jgi:hypothetical protein
VPCVHCDDCPAWQSLTVTIRGLVAAFVKIFTDIAHIGQQRTYLPCASVWRTSPRSCDWHCSDFRADLKTNFVQSHDQSLVFIARKISALIDCRDLSRPARQHPSTLRSARGHLAGRRSSLSGSPLIIDAAGGIPCDGRHTATGHGRCYGFLREAVPAQAAFAIGFGALDIARVCPCPPSLMS